MSNKPEALNFVGEAEQIELNNLLLDNLAAILPSPRQQMLMHTSIMGRITQSLAGQAGLLTVRLKDGVWQTLKSGVRYKFLWAGTAGSSVLIEFAPGASLPPHRHNWVEEGIVLRGDLEMGGLKLGVGDYHLSQMGSRHGSIRSQQGALAYLRGTSLGHKASVFREFLGGLLPLDGAPPVTVFANDNDGGSWLEIAEGVSGKQLWSDATWVSRICRLQPGASVPSHGHLLAEECMMLEGELFLGDTLLRAGEYQLAPAGSRHGEVYTDVGATLFVRGARDY